MGLGSFSHRGRPPTLADQLDFTDLGQVSPGLGWRRIRREDGIVYRTQFFVRCRKAS
jgi:hypothetical protein